MKEPVEGRVNAAGCYGLLMVISLAAAILGAFGLAAPEKNDQDIVITAEQ